MKTKSNSVKAKAKTPGLLNRTAQRSQRPGPQIDFILRIQNRGLATEAVLQLIQGKAPQIWELVEVVGAWVWVRFEEKQPREVTAVLSQLGFHWNNTRQVWQHPCGTITDASWYDPRRKYGSYFPAQQAA